MSNGYDDEPYGGGINFDAIHSAFGMDDAQSYAPVPTPPQVQAAGLGQAAPSGGINFDAIHAALQVGTPHVGNARQEPQRFQPQPQSAPADSSFWQQVSDIPEAALYGVAKGGAGLIRGAAGLVQMAGQGAQALGIPGGQAVADIGRTAADYYGNEQQNLGRMEPRSVQASPVDQPSQYLNPAWYVSRVAEAAPGLAPAFAAGPVGGAALMGAQTAGESYARDVNELGMSPGEAAARSLSQGAVAGALGGVGLGRVLEKTGGGSLGLNALKSAGKGAEWAGISALGAGAHQAIQDVGSQPIGDVAANALQAMKQQAVEHGPIDLLMGGAIHAAQPGLPMSVRDLADLTRNTNLRSLSPDDLNRYAQLAQAHYQTGDNKALEPLRELVAEQESRVPKLDLKQFEAYPGRDTGTIPFAGIESMQLETPQVQAGPDNYRPFPGAEMAQLPIPDMSQPTVSETVHRDNRPFNLMANQPEAPFRAGNAAAREQRTREMVANMPAEMEAAPLPTQRDIGRAYLESIISPQKTQLAPPEGQGFELVNPGDARRAPGIASYDRKMENIGQYPSERGVPWSRPMLPEGRRLELVGEAQSRPYSAELNAKQFKPEMYPVESHEGLPDARFARDMDPKAPSLRPEQITKFVSDYAKKRDWNNTPDLMVHATPDDIPGRRGELIRAEQTDHPVAAWFDGDKVHVIASRVKDHNALGTFMTHEVIGHYGLTGVLGKQRDAILDRVWDAHKNSDMMRDILGAYLPDHKIGEPLDPRRQRAMAEEVVAYMAQNDPRNSWLKRVVSAVRQWGRNMGFNIKMTDNDIISLIAKSRRYVERQSAPAVRAEDDLNASRVMTLGNTVERDPYLDSKIAFEVKPDDTSIKDKFKSVYAQAVEGEAGMKFLVRETADADLIKRFDEHVSSARGKDAKAEYVLEGLEKTLAPLKTEQDVYDYSGLRRMQTEVARAEARDKAQNRIDEIERAEMSKPHTEKELEALRAEIEALKPKAEWKGLDAEGAREYLDRLKDRLGPEKFAELEAISKEHTKFDRDVLKMSYENGLMSKEQYDSIVNAPESEFYSSMQREMDRVNKAFPVKEFKGSDKRTVNPIEGSIINLTRTMHWIERNNRNKMLAEVGQFLPDQVHRLQVDPTHAPRDAMLVINDGKREYWKLPESVARSMESLDKPALDGLMKLAKMPAAGLRAGLTSPEYAVRNWIRDQFTALMTSNYGYVPFVDAARGLTHMIKKDAVWDEVKASGILQSTMASLDRAHLQTKALQMTGYGKSLKGRAQYFAKNPMDAMLTLAKNITLSEPMEMATRVGAYAKARSKGATKGEATMEARNITLDFQRLAGNPNLRALNQIAAFWQAAVNDADVMLRRLGNYKNPKQVRETWLKVLAGVTMPTAMIWAWNNSDEERAKRYKDIPSWRKNLCWNIVTSPDGPVVSLPKPFALGTLFASVPERVLDHVAGGDTQASRGLLQQLVGGLLPDPTPTIIKPFIESTANYSMLTGRPIESGAQLRLAPGYRGSPSTSEISKKIGRMTNISPLQLDHWITSWTGNMGRIALDVSNAALRDSQTERVARNWYEAFPGVKAVVAGSLQGGENVDRAYAAIKEIAEAKATFKNLQSSRKMEEAREFMMDNRALLEMSGPSQRLQQQLSTLRKQEKFITDAKNMDGDVKRERIDKLREVEKRISAQFLKVYDRTQ